MDKGLEAERDGHWFKAVSAFSSVLETLNAMVPAPTRLQATALAHRCVVARAHVHPPLLQPLPFCRSARARCGLDEFAAASVDCDRALFMYESHNVARLCRARAFISAAFAADDAKQATTVIKSKPINAVRECTEMPPRSDFWHQRRPHHTRCS